MNLVSLTLRELEATMRVVVECSTDDARHVLAFLQNMGLRPVSKEGWGLLAADEIVCPILLRRVDDRWMLVGVEFAEGRTYFLGVDRDEDFALFVQGDEGGMTRTLNEGQVLARLKNRYWTEKGRRYLLMP